MFWRQGHCVSAQNSAGFGVKHCDLARPCLQDLETNPCAAASETLWDFSAGLESAKKIGFACFFFLPRQKKPCMMTASDRALSGVFDILKEGLGVQELCYKY